MTAIKMMLAIAPYANLLPRLDSFFSVFFCFSSKYNKIGSAFQSSGNPYRLNFFPRCTAARLRLSPILRFYNFYKFAVLYRPSLYFLFIEGDLGDPNFSFTEIDRYWDRVPFKISETRY